MLAAAPPVIDPSDRVVVVELIKAATAIRLPEDSAVGRTLAAAADSEVRPGQREAQQRTIGIAGSRKRLVNRPSIGE